MKKRLNLGVAATALVRDWIQMKGVNDPDIEEALQVVRRRDHLPEATKQLGAWFLERLTVDPGFPGPFADLGRSLLGTILDEVDWEAIVCFMRERED